MYGASEVSKVSFRCQILIVVRIPKRYLCSVSSEFKALGYHFILEILELQYVFGRQR